MRLRVNARPSLFSSSEIATKRPQQSYADKEASERENCSNNDHTYSRKRHYDHTYARDTETADIEKVANRKRINAEAEKLREKVNRENANIIKLKVAQDTAYWDLKNTFSQLENNHERLQQNMVEVQMQHETISGQYQDELRLRPETLNKLNSTREICDVLEEYSERLKANVSRCKIDQAMLAEAYNKSGEIVKEMKEKQSQSEEKNLQLINNLQEKVKLLAEHKEQMAQVFNTSKQHLDSELNDVRSKLATALSQKEELFVAWNDLSRKLDHTKQELEKKNENIVCLQTDMKKCIYECENQLAEMKNAKSVQERELKECTASNEVLKKALQNQEQFTQSISDQNNKLQEKISGLEEEHILNSEKVKGLASRLEDCNSQCSKLEKNVQELSEKAKELINEIDEKKMIIEQSFIEQQNLKDQLFALEEQKSATFNELDKATQELELRSVKIEEMSLLIQELQTKITEMEIILENNKVDNTNKINEINCELEIKIKVIEEKDKELDSNASTINQLMSELKNATDARGKLENSIEKMKKDMENNKNVVKEKENAFTKKVEQLEMAAKEKESELSQQMAIILETRKEKDRLQERLKSMQNTIDNIEKQVTGRSAPAAGSPHDVAEQDYNAVMRETTPINKRVGAPPLRKNEKVSGFVAPKEPSQRLAKAPNNTVYHFCSDSDTDNELMNFVPPLSLSQLKEAKTKRTTTFQNKGSDNKAKKPKNVE